MRKLSVMLLSVLLVFVCSVSMAATPYDALEPVTLRFGNGTAIGAAGDVWGELFCKYASEVTGGEIESGQFPDPSIRASDSNSSANVQIAISGSLAGAVDAIVEGLVGQPS